jgi:hypothetical protein
VRKAKQSGIERLEKYLTKIILEKGADQNQPFLIGLLLVFLKGVSVIFASVVAIRYFFYRIGFLRRYPLGIQVISIGNVTAGGTGKTPVTEMFARALASKGRKVAILSRGYRRKEAPWWQRMFTQVIDPPLVVSDGKRVLLQRCNQGALLGILFYHIDAANQSAIGIDRGSGPGLDGTSMIITCKNVISA